MRIHTAFASLQSMAAVHDALVYRRQILKKIMLMMWTALMMLMMLQQWDRPMTASATFDTLDLSDVLSHNCPHNTSAHAPWQGVAVFFYALWLFIFVVGAAVVARFEYSFIQKDVTQHRAKRNEYVQKLLRVQTIFRHHQVEHNSAHNGTRTPTTKSNDAHEKNMAQHYSNSSCRQSYRDLGLNDCTCSICLEEFKIGDQVCYSPNCPHIFHVDSCMRECLLRQDACPLCRTQYLVPATIDGKERDPSYVVPLEMFTPDDRPLWHILTNST